MKIYIIEDDISVISVLEDIVEQNSLGTICGDNDGADVELHQVLALDPDLILIDLLMPGRDGIQIIRELREGAAMPSSSCSPRYRIRTWWPRPILPGWSSSSRSPSIS